MLIQKNTELFSFDKTIAKDIFEGTTYPWEVLAKIGDFIKKIGATLPADEYERIGDKNIWIAKDAVVFPSAVPLAVFCRKTDDIRSRRSTPR